MRFTTHRDHRFNPRGGAGIHIPLAEIAIDGQQLVDFADYSGGRDDAAPFGWLQVGGIKPEIRPVSGKGTVGEGIDAVIDFLAEPPDEAFADLPNRESAVASSGCTMIALRRRPNLASISPSSGAASCVRSR